MPHIPASLALARFRVLDLTQVRAGPTAARQLADWGADVIQVQMPESMRGDDTLGGQEGSDYQYTHRNKRSITLNLKEPEGIEVLKRLVETADVLLENFRPDVKTRSASTTSALEGEPAPRVREHLGFGQTGPYATRPGFDQIAQGHGGAHVGHGPSGPGPGARGACRSRTCAPGIFAAYGVTVALPRAREPRARDSGCTRRCSRRRCT
jgi:formyl-CoA transferase